MLFMRLAYWWNMLLYLEVFPVSCMIGSVQLMIMVFHAETEI